MFEKHYVRSTSIAVINQYFKSIQLLFPSYIKWNICIHLICIIDWYLSIDAILKVNMIWYFAFIQNKTPSFFR